MKRIDSGSPSKVWRLRTDARGINCYLCRENQRVALLRGVLQPEWVAVDDDGRSVVVDYGRGRSISWPPVDPPPSWSPSLCFFETEGTMRAEYPFEGTRPFLMKSDLLCHVIVFATVNVATSSLDQVVGAHLSDATCWQRRVWGGEVASVKGGRITLRNRGMRCVRLGYDGIVIDPGWWPTNIAAQAPRRRSPGGSAG